MSDAKRLYWLAFTVTVAIFCVMQLWYVPLLSPLVDGVRVKPLDLHLTGYDFATAKSYLEGIGPSGIYTYLTEFRVLDRIFPALLALITICALIKFDRGGWGWLLSLLSLAGMVFDYLENAALDRLMRAGPDAMTEQMVSDASSWTLLKAISDVVAFSGLLLLLIASVVWPRVKSKPNVKKSKKTKEAELLTEEKEVKINASDNRD